ncbi:MAG: hypothetical protein Q8L09_01420 [Candidatus Moranbacteria bacterium]|nr:hypothetical protein [Candidatus Moranbacteria bacterium]
MHLGTYNNSHHRKFFWAFILLVIVTAVVVVNFTLSRATIVIRPKIENKSTKINLTVDAKTLKPDYANLILPGRIVESEGEITRNTSAVTARKVEDFGKGTVKIKNIWKKDFFLQTGAQLVQGESPETVGTALKNIFLLDSEVNVPANGEIEALITAKNKGLAGNIPSGKFYFLRMSKWNRERIWAENESEFSGGEIETKIVTEDDINQAVQKTAEELGKIEMEKIKTKLSPEEKVSPGLTRVEILESRASVAPETVAGNFQVFVRGKVASIVYSEKELKDAALSRFKAQVGASQEISSIDETSIKYELSDISNTDGKAEVNVIVPAVLMSKLSSKMLDKKAIIGYNESALRERYAKFPEIDSIDVKFFPFWVKSVPSFESQVGFEIKAD